MIDEETFTNIKLMIPDMADWEIVDGLEVAADASTDTFEGRASALLFREAAKRLRQRDADLSAAYDQGLRDGNP